MSVIKKNAPGSNELLMGNEAIARGALEAGVQFAAAYPGNPSSEIIGTLSQVADDLGIYVEWSVNEKVALEAAASASFSGLRAISVMKQNGVNVASDFILNLNLSGVGKGGLILVTADDPAALSSTNEEDSRFIAKLADLPLLEPATFQEAKDMTKWAFDLSEAINSLVIVRSVSRISHARGNVILGDLPQEKKIARYDTSKIFIPVAAPLRHLALHLKLAKVGEMYESSPCNWYVGPEKPELLMITSGSGWFYSLEAVKTLKGKDRVGILKIGTTWPLPSKLLAKHMANAKRVLFVEEVDPFLENNVKELAAEWSPEIGSWTFYGKGSGHVPSFGEINPDLIINALAKAMNQSYSPREAGYGGKALEMTKTLVPNRDLGFCAGCPHRATFWAIKAALKLDGRGGFVTGDIGCYSLGLGPAGFFQLKTMHAMGSGTGLATGFGQLHKFGFDQPVLAVCGDSTFFHAAIPALINGVYNKSNFVMVVLDNSATAMTGFQPHAGTGETATGSPAPVVDIEKLCAALGIRVETCDPFDLQDTTEKVLDLINEEGGVRVLISRRKCALVRENFYVTIGETYGASQRGGAVMSHLRLSRESQHSPLIPEGQADIVVALEPVEALRVIGQYGNPAVAAVVNSRPIYPTAVTVGEAEYPSWEKIKQTICELARKAWFVDATEIALSYGSPIFTNIIMVGALAGTNLLPLNRKKFEETIKESFPSTHVADNLKAFERGLEMTQGF